MNFSEFKYKYIKKPVIEYPNNREGKIPLVTVKVVTYNHANFIKECLDSVLMQKTNFDFEILIAEDDSNDGTREICIEYADKYSDKIRLFLNSRENNIPINGRPSGIFNSVYSNFLIQSKYIALIEGDDYWTDETSLKQRVDFLEKNDNYVICYHQFIKLYQNDKETGKSLQLKKKKSIISSSTKVITSIHTLTIVYRNLLKEELFDLDMLKTSSGDVILRGKLSLFGSAKFLKNIKPAVYRIHDGGIYSLQLPSKQAINSIEARKYLISFFNKKGVDNKHLAKNLIFYYYIFFRKILKEEKKIKLIYIYQLLFYAFRYKIPLPAILVNKLKQKLKSKNISWKITK